MNPYGKGGGEELEGVKGGKLFSHRFKYVSTCMCHENKTGIMSGEDQLI